MTWVRIDDHFDEHPKLAAVGPIGWGVWLAGLAYCNRNLTDGFIPLNVAEGIGGTWRVYTPSEADPENRLSIWTIARGCGMMGEDMDTEWVIGLLVDHGLWEHVEGGYVVHDYHDYQPTKEQVLSERRKNADRQKKHREGRNAGSNGVSNDATNGPVTDAPYPYPVPVPLDTYIDPPAFYMERARRKRLSQKERDWLEDLHARFSRARLIYALQVVDPGEGYLKRVDEYLEGAA